jgi:hypothetical protein
MKSFFRRTNLELKAKNIEWTFSFGLAEYIKLNQVLYDKEYLYIVKYKMV